MEKITFKIDQFFQDLDKTAIEKDVVDTLFRTIDSVCPDVYISLWFFDEPNNQLLLLGERGFRQTGVSPTNRRIDVAERSAVGLAIQRRQPIMLDMSRDDDKSIPKAKEFIVVEGIKQILVLPCLYDKYLLGVLLVATRLPRVWANSEKNALSFLGLRSFIRIRRISEMLELNLLTELLTSVSAITTIDYLNFLAAIFRKRTGSKVCLLWLLKEKSNEFEHCGVSLKDELVGDIDQDASMIALHCVQRDKTIRLFQYGDPTERLKHGLIGFKSEPASLCTMSEFDHAIVVPIRLASEGVASKCIGAVMLVRDASLLCFLPYEQDSLVAACDYVAIAVDRRRTIDRLIGLLNVTNSLYLAKGSQDVLDTIAVGAADLFGADIAFVARLEGESTRLSIPSQFGIEDEDLQGLNLKVGKGIVGRALAEGKEIVVSETNEWPGYIQVIPQKPMRSEIAVPMIIEGSKLGVLNLESTRPGHFAIADIETISAIKIFANQAGLAITAAELAEEKEGLHGKLMAAFPRITAAIASVGLGHEVKNSLNGFSGNLKYIEELISDLQLPQRKEIELAKKTITSAQTEIVRLSGLAIRAIDMSKVQTRKETTYLNRIVETFVTLLNKPVSQNGLKLIVTSLDSALNVPKSGYGNPIFADETQIGQVLVNFIMNAVDAYTEMKKRGPIEIMTIKIEKDDKSYAAFKVTDYGIGMDEEVKKKIFTPFFTTKGAKGLGLGLQIAEEIIKDHEGDIEFTSGKWKGTSFTVSLPINRKGL